jgi:hypothetical protein
MSGSDRASPIAFGTAALELAIEQARRRLTDARRARDRAVATRARRGMPTSVHVLAIAILTAAFALPSLVVAVAFATTRAFPCTTYARVKVTVIGALVSWAMTAAIWMGFRRRRRRQGRKKDPQGSRASKSENPS